MTTCPGDSNNFKPAAACGLIRMLLSTVFCWFFALKATATPRSHAFPLGDRNIDINVMDRAWGAYTPFFSVEPYKFPPNDCTIDQVNIIQRHGARFPTSGSSERILLAIKKLLSAETYRDHCLYFLHNYTYTLGTSDLVPYGAAQSEEAGRSAYARYASLVSQDNLPFVRASGSTRVVDSAGNWTHGFGLASDHAYHPSISVILDEHLNNTLDDHMCPNAGTPDEQTSTWIAIFGTPIAERLNNYAPGAGLTSSDVPPLMSLCAFETLAEMAWSPFCDLFSAAEFDQYEYYSDLEKFYRTGYGQDLGPVQGVGYINELIARLTEKPVRDNTQTNKTLDASPITFPLDRTIYADFSHDNEMMAIYSAMGLFRPGSRQPLLDPTQIDPERTWITSHLTPFSGRMVVERMRCTGARMGFRFELADLQREGRYYVRILVNDAVQPLLFCGATRLEGLCELDAFVESQSYARHDGEGDFERCF